MIRTLLVCQSITGTSLVVSKLLLILVCEISVTILTINYLPIIYLFFRI